MKYAVKYFEDSSAELLVMEIDVWFKQNHNISIRDISYLTEIRGNRLNPSLTTVHFIGILTYKLLTD